MTDTSELTDIAPSEVKNQEWTESMSDFINLLNTAKDVYSYVFDPNYKSGSWKKQIAATLMKVFALLEELSLFPRKIKSKKFTTQLQDQVKRWIKFFGELFVPVMQSFCSLVFLDYVSETAHKLKLRKVEIGLRHIDLIHGQLSNDIMPNLKEMIETAGDLLKAFLQNDGKIGIWELRQQMFFFRNLEVEIRKAADWLREADTCLAEVTRDVDIYKRETVAANNKLYWRFGACAAIGTVSVLTGGIALPALTIGMTGLTMFERKMDISHTTDIDELLIKIRERELAQRLMRLGLGDLERRLSLFKNTGRACVENVPRQGSVPLE